jgi:hypothetical protein
MVGRAESRMTVHRIRRYGAADRFGDFPRSIYVPPAEFRLRVANWWQSIEYLPPFSEVEPRQVTRETITHHPWSV